MFNVLYSIALLKLSKSSIDWYEVMAIFALIIAIFSAIANITMIWVFW